MPEGFASLAKANVQFRKAPAGFDEGEEWELACTAGKQPMHLLSIEAGVTMVDVLAAIQRHAMEYHPETKEH